MRLLFRCLVSLVLGTLLLYPLAVLYAVAHLPVFHVWGIAHGSLTIALPALVAAAFVALGTVPLFGKSQDPGRRLVACALVFVVATATFSADQRSDRAFSFEHGAIYAGLFLVVGALCFGAERPLLIPLFLLLPMVLDTVLQAAPFYDFAIESFVRDLQFKVAPAALAAYLPLVVFRLARSGGTKPATPISQGGGDA